MKITVTDAANADLATNYGDATTIRLALTQGCCGKSFAIEPGSAVTDDDVSSPVGDYLFVMQKDDAGVASEIAIDSPGPIGGFMITNLKATGGCACGRSFFID